MIAINPNIGSPTYTNTSRIITASHSNISKIKKSVANIHPTIEISNANTIIETTNDINPLIMFVVMNFVSVLI